MSFVDCHASHIDLNVIDLARDNDVIFFCLTPYDSCSSTPVFKSLKSHFSEAVNALSFAKKDFIVPKCEFARVVKTPFE